MWLEKGRELTSDFEFSHEPRERIVINEQKQLATQSQKGKYQKQLSEGRNIAKRSYIKTTKNKKQKPHKVNNDDSSVGIACW